MTRAEVFSAHFEDDFILIFSSMIKPKFTFFQMKIKSVFLHSPETNQASFGITPKTFYSVNVTMLVGKFILAVPH